MRTWWLLKPPHHSNAPCIINTVVPTSSREEHALADIIKNVVLPQLERVPCAEIFAACPRWRAGMELPQGISIIRKPLRGKRVPARKQRAYGTTSVIEASWPEDNLYSARTPKLYFILSFPTKIQFANYLVHCQPGSILLAPPGIPFTQRYESPLQNQETLQMMPYHHGLICWHTRRWEDANGQSHVRERTCSIPHSQVAFYLHQLSEEATGQREHRGLICDSLLKITVAQLHRELQELPVLQTGEIDDETDSPKQYQTTYSIKQAEEYIERNLREPLSIDKVARYVCMSRTVFTAQFRARTGKTFSQYLQDMRFDAACELLKDGDLGIKHIAAAVGLKPNRMRVLFHERKGLTPQQFRQMSRNI